MTHEKLLKEEELQPEDIFSFNKSTETINHAVFARDKLYL